MAKGADKCHPSLGALTFEQQRGYPASAEMNSIDYGYDSESAALRVRRDHDPVDVPALAQRLEAVVGRVPVVVQ